MYTGKKLITENGLEYDVIMQLMEGLLDQGYHMFCDNFYSSPTLFNDLFDKGCFATGTVQENRVGYPSKIGSSLPKKRERVTIYGGIDMVS